jgi:hypothetical protein
MILQADIARGHKPHSNSTVQFFYNVNRAEQSNEDTNGKDVEVVDA